MKTAALLAAFACLLAAKDRKPLPGQAGNDDIEMVGAVIVDRAEVTQAVGEDMGPGYVVVKIKVTPKTDKPLAVSLDDFTIISSKDGQRSQALSPGQIAGQGALVVKRAPNQPGGAGTQTNGPLWGGVSGAGIGNKRSREGGVEANVDKDAAKPSEPRDKLLDALTAKCLPEKASLEPLEGLLYFPIDGKIKPKDLRVQYKGPAGRLEMEFLNPK
ncbi:MAG TPA: hypothetical protein VKS01_10795 [Bryobacteraceae bacterium]|nr:hypothetical protein [Bryobacteraceae bacterium]